MRKPFDVLVEGQFRKESGEDRTAIELFIKAIEGWEAEVRRQMGEVKLDQN